MQIWIDADACPRVIKEILYKAAERVKVPLTLVANRSLRVPRSRFIQTVQVDAGADVADQEIVDRLAAGDLVVTADIPLAAAVIEKGGVALDPRGVFFNEDTIGERLALRNLMDELRSGGAELGGPAAFSKSDRTAFANQLDRFLTQNRS